MVAIGTDKGSVLIFTYGDGRQILRPYLTIPPPPTSGMVVVTCKLALGKEKASVFVGYKRSSNSLSPRGSTAGISCYDMLLPGPNLSPISAPSARHDLDGRYVSSSNLCGAVSTKEGVLFTVVSTLNINLCHLAHRHSSPETNTCPGSTRWSLHLLHDTQS